MLKFGSMTQDHVLSHQKNPHVLDKELPPFSAFKVCHLVSNSRCHPTANSKVVRVPRFAKKLVFKLRFKKIYLEVDEVIAGDVIAKVFEKMTY